MKMNSNKLLILCVLLALGLSFPSFGAELFVASKEACAAIGKTFVRGHKKKNGELSKSFCRKKRAKKQKQ